jgi:hypothetical protein
MKVDAGLQVQVHKDGSWVSGAALVALGFTPKPPQMPADVPPVPPAPPAPASAKAVTAEYIPPTPASAAPAATTIAEDTAAAPKAVEGVSAEDMAWYAAVTAKLLNGGAAPDDMFRWADLDVRIKAANA